MEDELKIDFGKYIETLVRQWQLIITTALGLGILAVALSLLINQVKPTYQAVALIASTKTQTDVSLGSAIKTTSEETLAKDAQTGAQYFYDRKARLQSYVTLVQNGDVANKVLAEIGPELKNDERSPSVLLQMVDAQLLNSTDTIQITVKYSTPQVAADIANAWARAYVEKINGLYGDSSAGTSYAVIKDQTDRAKNDYDRAQAALTAFMAQNKVDEWNRQIDETKTIITSLRGARSTAVSTIINAQTGADQQIIAELYKDQAANQLLALQQDQQARQQLITAYITELSKGRQEAFNQQVEDRIAQLEKAYADSRQAKLFADNAVAMQNAVNQGGESSAQSNALALVLLKTQIYASFQGTNNLQIQDLPTSVGNNITDMTQTGMVSDLSALIKALNTRQADLTRQINTLSKQLRDGAGITVDLALDSTGDLAKAIQTRYPELFTTGSLSNISLSMNDKSNPLEQEAVRRSQDLLSLKNLDNVMSFSTSGTEIEKKIEQYEQQIRDLNSQISKATSTQTELTRARDLAWTTYSALATKEAEVNVAAQTTGVEVAVGSPAIPPTDHVVKTSIIGLAAIILGLIAGVVAAYVYEFWQTYKGKSTVSIRPLSRGFQLISLKVWPREPLDETSR